jgi:hypothetical protein
MSQDGDQEFLAMQTVFKSLEPLAPEARHRVMAYINSRLEISPPALSLAVDAEEAKQVESIEHEQAGARKFASFAELLTPRSQIVRATVR